MRCRAVLASILVVIAVMANGCALTGRSRDTLVEPVKLEIRPDREVTVAVSRVELRRRLADPILSRIRVVRLTLRADAPESGSPEYRLFDLHRDGPYAALGLKSSDVLLAAHDYIVIEPIRFQQFVMLLPEEQSESSLTIRRAGAVHRLRLVFQP